MKGKFKLLVSVGLLLVLCSCGNGDGKNRSSVVYKGVYSLGPQQKSFMECESGNEFWVRDKSDSLEVNYNRLNFEKPYEHVYVEVLGDKIKATKADTLDAHYDSIIVVKKLLKITKVIPDVCNQ